MNYPESWRAETSLGQLYQSIEEWASSRPLLTGLTASLLAMIVGGLVVHFFNVARTSEALRVVTRVAVLAIAVAGFVGAVVLAPVYSWRASSGLVLLVLSLGFFYGGTRSLITGSQLGSWFGMALGDGFFAIALGVWGDNNYAIAFGLGAMSVAAALAAFGHVYDGYFLSAVEYALVVAGFGSSCFGFLFETVALYAYGFVLVGIGLVSIGVDNLARGLPIGLAASYGLMIAAGIGLVATGATKTLQDVENDENWAGILAASAGLIGVGLGVLADIDRQRQLSTNELGEDESLTAVIDSPEVADLPDSN